MPRNPRKVESSLQAVRYELISTGANMLYQANVRRPDF